MNQMYEVPEIVELGAADALTLGGTGCASDGNDCKRNFPDTQVPPSGY